MMGVGPGEPGVNFLTCKLPRRALRRGGLGSQTTGGWELGPHFGVGLPPIPGIPSFTAAKSHLQLSSRCTLNAGCIPGFVPCRNEAPCLVFMGTPALEAGDHETRPSHPLTGPTHSSSLNRCGIKGWTPIHTGHSCAHGQHSFMEDADQGKPDEDSKDLALPFLHLFWKLWIITKFKKWTVKNWSNPWKHYKRPLRKLSSSPVIKKLYIIQWNVTFSLWSKENDTWTQRGILGGAMAAKDGMGASDRIWIQMAG